MTHVKELKAILTVRNSVTSTSAHLISVMHFLQVQSNTVKTIEKILSATLICLSQVYAGKAKGLINGKCGSKTIKTKGASLKKKKKVDLGSKKTK